MKIVLLISVASSLVLIAVLSMKRWHPADVGSTIEAPLTDRDGDRPDVPLVFPLEGSIVDGSRIVAASEPHDSPASPDPIRSTASEVGSIHGRVIDPSSPKRLSSGGMLFLHFESPETGGVGDPRENWQSRMDRAADIPLSGEFELKNMGFGTWGATCRIAGRAPVLARIVLTHDASRVEHDFELKRGRLLRVSLRDADGRPLIPNLARSGSELGELLGPFACSARPNVGATPAASGEFIPIRSHLLDKGRSNPWCELETEWQEVMWVGVTIGDSILASDEVQPDANEVSLVVSAKQVLRRLGALRVKIVDDRSSQVLGGAEISLNDVPGHSDKWRSTDRAGTARFDGLLPGDVQFSVSLDGWVRTGRSVHVMAETCTDVEVRMETSISISGTVTDESGKPLTRLVRAIPAKGDRLLDWGDFWDAQPASDGSFVIAGLSHREYVLMDARSHAANNSNAPQYNSYSIRFGMTLVDARADSVAGVRLVITGRDDSVGPSTNPK